MIRRITIAALAGTAVCGFPAQALAVRTFEGRTTQSRKIILVYEDTNLIRKAWIGWFANCRSGNHHVSTATDFDSKVPQDGQGAFDDRTGYVIRDGGGIRVHVKLRFWGRLVAAATPGELDSVVGHFRATVRVTRRGHTIDRCTMPGPVDFTATPR